MLLVPHYDVDLRLLWRHQDLYLYYSSFKTDMVYWIMGSFICSSAIWVFLQAVEASQELAGWLILFGESFLKKRIPRISMLFLRSQLVISTARLCVYLLQGQHLLIALLYGEIKLG